MLHCVVLCGVLLCGVVLCCVVLCCVVWGCVVFGVVVWGVGVIFGLLRGMVWERGRRVWGGCRWGG